MSRLADEKDPEILRKALLLYEAHNHALTKKLAEAARELAALKGESVDKQLRLEALERQLAKLTKQIFGNSSERRETDGAPAGDADDEKKDKKREKKPKRGHGPTPQPDLPRIVVDHDLDEADKACPKCGGCLHEMKDQFEEHGEIDVLPLRFVYKHHRRKKYACNCGGCIETALGPDKLAPGARYSVDFAISVAIAKYCDHLPLERQVRMMARDGLVVTSQTLWDQIEQLAWVTESVMPRLLSYVLSHPVVGADETTWELLGKQPGQAKSWFVWVVHTRDAVFYAIKGGRSTKTAKEFLGGFAGTLMCDGYAAYVSLSEQCPRVVLAHCWAHVRREFVEIEKSFAACRGVLDLIAKLYLVERECASGPAGDADRSRLRKEQSQKIVEQIEAWFYATVPTCLPESGLHKAIGYMVNMWKGLVLFLDDPAIPLDNNGTERAARGPVLGRKNHYGSRSLRGTEVAATFYSLVESAKLNDLDPRLYLRFAVRAALRHETVPLPHEVKSMLADGTLRTTDFDDHTEGILKALAATNVLSRSETPTTPISGARAPDSTSATSTT